MITPNSFLFFFFFVWTMPLLIAVLTNSYIIFPVVFRNISYLIIWAYRFCFTPFSMISHNHMFHSNIDFLLILKILYFHFDKILLYFSTYPIFFIKCNTLFICYCFIRGIVSWPGRGVTWIDACWNFNLACKDRTF